MKEANSGDSIQQVILDSNKQAFLETVDDHRARLWLWMYFSGFSVAQIAEEDKCPQARVYVSLKANLAKFNQFVHQEKGQPVKGRNTAASAKADKKAEMKKATSAAKYRPKKQAKRLYTKMRKRIESLFEKKYYIGDIRISQEEYEELLEYTRFVLSGVSTSSRALGDDPVLAVALVQIGMRCYSGGNYWGNAFKQELKLDNSQAYQTFLRVSFTQTLKKHKKFILSESEVVQSILFHSFVTDYYSKGLFELLFQYYVNDLERDINRNDKYQMQALMETLQLRAEMSEEENEAFTSQFTGRGSRAYKLRQHTLQAISAYPTHSSMRLRRILRLIDKAFWKDSVPQKPVSRLTRLFVEWLKESPSFSNEYKLYKSGGIRNRGKKHFSSPYLYANIRDTSFTLMLPPQIVRQEYCENLQWRISTEHSEQRINIDTYPVLTGFKTEQSKTEIEVNDLFFCITCALYCGETLVRSFPPIPKSDFRLFDMEGDYAARIFKIPMCAYAPNDFSIKSPALLDTVKCGKLTRWDFEFVSGDIMILPNGKSMVAGEKYIDGLATRGIVNSAHFHTADGNDVPVYKSLPDLLLTIPKSKMQGTVIDINGTRYRLGDCEYDDFEAADSRGTRAFYLQLSQFDSCLNNAENRIILDIPGNTYAKDYSFAYVPGLEFTFDGAPYVFEERGTLIFPKTVSALCVSHNAENLAGENGFKFDITGDLVSITVKINQALDLVIDVPVFMWSVDGRLWNTCAAGDVWHSDFFKFRQIYVRSPEARLEFGTDDDYDDGDDDAEQHIVSCSKNQDGLFTLDLTRFRSWITREKIAHSIIMRLGKSNYEFACVYARSYVSSCDLSADYENSMLTCYGDIIGKSDYYVDITHLQSGARVAEKCALKNGEYAAKDRLRNGEYLVEFFEAEADDEFFDEVEYLPIHSFKKTLINRDDLSGNSIRLMSFRPKEHSVLHTGFAKPIWIRRLDRTAPFSYEGHIEDPEKGDLLVQVLFEGRNDLRYFSLRFWDEYEEAFLDFIYDSKRKTIVREEEPDLESYVRYRRYKVLYDTDYVFYGSVENPNQEADTNS